VVPTHRIERVGEINFTGLKGIRLAETKVSKIEAFDGEADYEIGQ